MFWKYKSWVVIIFLLRFVCSDLLQITSCSWNKLLLLVIRALFWDMITFVTIMTANIVFYFIVCHTLIDKAIEMSLSVEFSICFFALFLSFDLITRKRYWNLWLIARILWEVFWILLQLWNVRNERSCVFDRVDVLNALVIRNFDWLSLRTTIVVVHYVNKKIFVNQHTLHDFDCFRLDVIIERVQLFKIEFKNSESLVFDCFLCLKF